MVHSDYHESRFQNKHPGRKSQLWKRKRFAKEVTTHLSANHCIFNKLCLKAKFVQDSHLRQCGIWRGPRVF